MPTDIRLLTPEMHEALQNLLDASELSDQFDKFQGANGATRMLADRYLDPAGVRLAFVDDAPVGFAICYLLPFEAAPFAMIRVGVLAAHRRKGIATALLRASEDWARTQTVRPIVELSASAWIPCEGGDALAAHSGYRHDRWFWLMERPRGAAPAPQWPDGITTRTWDGGDAMLHDAVEAYNDSFAQHYRHVHGSVESLRGFMTRPGTAPEQLCVAYRATTPAGFCRCERLANRGEIAVLGTVRAARGIGLGRALLRWGVHWLEQNSTTPVTLLVDGENEGALALYRAEGFAVTRTRRVWTRPARA